MKTTIIQLESHDDVVSIKDKMSWYSCQRMILVWPKRGRILNGELELKLIQRTAKSLGSEVAFVTHNQAIKEFAESLNISVFPSISLAEKSQWLKVDQNNVKKEGKGYSAINIARIINRSSNSGKNYSNLTKIIVMAICILALCSLFLFLIPSATITVYPQMKIQKTEIDITASESFSGINPSGGLPVSVETVEISGDRSTKSTGKVVIPSAKAGGEVLFVNLTAKKVTIPAQTILLTSAANGIPFITLNEVALPAVKGSEVTVQAEAVQEGSEGNIKPGEINLISGDIGESVQVTNPDAFRGGAGIEAPSPTEADYQLLEEQLLADLQAQALDHFNSNLETGSELISESVTVDEVIVKESEYQAGKPSDEAKLRMTVRFTAMTYKKQDEYALADVILNASIPSGYEAIEDSIDLQNLGDFQLDEKGQAIWSVEAVRLLSPIWDHDQLASSIAGKSRNQAVQIISQFLPQAQPAEIKQVFSWGKRMPYLATQIHFIEAQ